ncbi:CusA/CzcA family heavy metal efflux RND transporter [Candidatus Methylospira mobilis]|uniref:efflux RND transporter permease subunit n=1 Tax=Candidatus Methylospira mobilis TaxID=1808979 RepID=UPI0028EF942A|nr:CusA/CzcA family heavy metal efflux RND transporter [Candidatus Methylospira mobilis]WNV06574.1 CusA/CzcA family heavy metal efflux RND transporter [Candidatus Methylospira mobilis]
MSGLIQFALTQRLLVLILTLLLAGAGYVATVNIPIDAFPDVSPVQVKIIVKAPGMTPEEVETRITAPIELELLGIPKQTMLRSIAKYALTDITIDFEEGADIYWARQQIAERINAVWGVLPEGVEGGMAPMTTPLGEMFMFTVEGGDLTLMERRNLLDWVIRPALRTVPGVADVNTLGGLVRSYEVIPNNAALSSRGITTEALISALKSNNRNDGAGRLAEGEESLLVRAEGQIRDLDDVKAIVVANQNGVAITVGDVAEVRIGELTRYGAVSQNGEGEAVEGLVLGLRGSNARQVVVGVEKKLDEIQTALPEGVKLSVFYNRSELVNRAIHTVVRALVEAIVLVLILLVLFLGDLRAALTVAGILPLSALFTFLLMHQFGITANLMSLGGLAIAIGKLVDPAVVVVENITTHLADPKMQGKLPRLHLIYRAMREVTAPVVSGALIIGIVFVPLLSLEGLEGKLFRPVAFTNVFAMTGSLFMSMLVIPVIASWLMRNVKHEEPWLARKLHEIYKPALLWALAHTRQVIIVAALLLLATAVIYTRIGKTFMPTLDEGTVIIQVEKLPSINLEQSVRLDEQIQKALFRHVPAVARVVSRVGSDEIGLDPMGLNETDNFLVLKPEDQWGGKTKEQVLDEIRRVMESIPGIDFGFTQPIQMRVTEMLTGVRGDVAVKLYGPDLAVLNEEAEAIANAMRTVNGASDVFTIRNAGMQYLQVRIDRLAIGRMGLDGDALERTLRAQIEGLKLGIVQEDIKRTPLLLRASSDPEQLATLQISLPDGRRVPLSAVAHIERTEGVVAINRERGQRYAVVRSNVEGRDLVGFVEDARKAVAERVALPSGYYLTWGGQFENQQRAAKRLAIVIPISIGLIFMLLFTTFGSVRLAVLVLTNVPFSLVGGVTSLWLSGEYLSVSASVGFISLLGIAVLNGVVMVTYFNQLRAQGLAMDDVVMTGAMRRLRPVLMTASIAAFGLIPLLFASGPGSEIQRPLAIVGVGGLVTSTLLTLILLPILYRRFGEAKSA